MDVRVVVCCMAMALAAAGGVAAHGGGWDVALATFYGDMDGGETMQGACGYGNLFEQGYGLETTALSSALFNDGALCGACFQLRCYDNPQYCRPGARVTVTATNFCPANYSKPDGNWCNPPLKHFDLAMPMFVSLVADYHVGIIPVQYRRVPCVRKGGVRFEMKGNQWWALVLVYNVAGAGDVTVVSVRDGGSPEWVAMGRNWGQNWNGPGSLVRRPLSFRVTAGDGRSVELGDVVPANWQFGQSFEGKQQF